MRLLFFIFTEIYTTMKQLFIFLFMGLSISYAQNDEACKALFSKPINDDIIESSKADFRKNLHTLSKCLQLSNNELNAITASAYFSPIILDIYKREDATYKTLYNRLKTYINTEPIQQIRKRIVLKDKLDSIGISLHNWSTIKPIFSQLGLPKDEMVSTKKFLVKNVSKTYSFYSFLRAYSIFKKDTGAIMAYKQYNLKRMFNQPEGKVSLQFFLKEANLNEKKLLLFFSGYDCTTCNKLLAATLNTPEVLELIEQNYHMVSLFVDDNIILPKHQWTGSKRSRKILKTKGMQAKELQRINFKNNKQPYFVILDNNGQQLRETQFLNTKDFIEFLKKI